ncbi:hypothetical protein PF005_g1226 [Phytophthora fragariae]|uniref:Uncharacterized protein n=1 Tax=Phytophthora fragariae TaxID=53985 RepID=A0A6A3ZFZ7_9STRA|nr:hypothetical protein PF011_g4700 [Phytophthora fragariae]KAE9236018.1 hypothetical protein PF005_g1226 [Phytophthora fragariae]KAE9252008.1 hypothetical protein PF002_g4026 [Phytophthora fragariae]
MTLTVRVTVYIVLVIQTSSPPAPVMSTPPSRASPVAPSPISGRVRLESSPDARPVEVLRRLLPDDSRLSTGDEADESVRQRRKLGTGTPRSKRRLSTGDEADEPPRHRSKITLSAAALASPLPWLRSGRKFSHPLVVEAVTMQISSLTEFELVQRDDTDAPGSVVSN